MTLIEAGTAILVTGASGGIGTEIAEQAGRAGALVGVHGSRPESAQAAIDDLRRKVPTGHFIPLSADARDFPAMRAMVNEFARTAGRLDALVDCAVTGPESVTGPFRNLDPQVFGVHNAMSIGVLENVCFAALPHLAERGGAIVAFTSDSGKFAAPLQTMVGASRAGIIGFVRNLAMELARDGIRVNCVSPSFVEGTPIFERFTQKAGERADRSRSKAGLGLPRPGDIAPLVLFLCGPNSAKITGQTISVNGGLNA